MNRDPRQTKLELEVPFQHTLPTKTQVVLLTQPLQLWLLI